MAITPQWLFTLKLVAAVGCGLVAGVFFAFSTFVMPALARLQPSQGITAMQSINITAINPFFMIAVFGTAFACLVLAVFVLFKWQQLGAVPLLVGALLYLVGTIGVTVAYNVPLNDALAIVNSNSAEGATLWAKYLNDWTLWNHVRTLASLAASALLMWAIA